MAGKSDINIRQIISRGNIADVLEKLDADLLKVNHLVIVAMHDDDTVHINYANASELETIGILELAKNIMMNPEEG